jgi:hypothetical protein
MTLIYLYSYQLPVQLSETNHGAPNYNRPMYNYNIKLYKNNHNTIDFVVRNNDRKPVRLVDCRVEVIVQNSLDNQVVLEKQACVTDEIKGRAQLVISASETENWPLGSYYYNVKLTRPNQNQEFLFVDIADNATASFELLPAVGGILVPSNTIRGEQFTPITFDWDTNTTYQTSGAMPAVNSVGVDTGFYTVAIYTTGYHGRFKLQASLQNLAPVEKSWFDVELMPGVKEIAIEPTSASPQAFNFTLDAQWIRFLYIDEIDNLGSFDKVVYKIT